jgi:hypothetical protein
MRKLVTIRPKAIAVFGLGLLGSQAGHLVVYQLRYGVAAQQVQSTGVHSYFPLLIKTSLGAIAAASLAGLLIVGFARIVSGRQVRPVAQPSFAGLLAALFTFQLVVFAVQEVSESLVVGSRVMSAPDLLLWGTLGQLPIAIAGTLALRWLGTRIESAVGAIRDVVGATVLLLPAAPPVAVPVTVAPDRALLMSRVAGMSLARRGPPAS